MLANMILDNVQHVDFVADLLRHMNERGLHPGRTRGKGPGRVDSARGRGRVHTCSGSTSRTTWSTSTATTAPESSCPTSAGLDRYVDKCEKVAADGFAGFAFS